MLGKTNASAQAIVLVEREQMPASPVRGHLMAPIPQILRGEKSPLHIDQTSQNLELGQKVRVPLRIDLRVDKSGAGPRRRQQH
jgi:hypothetical protein